MQYTQQIHCFPWIWIFYNARFWHTREINSTFVEKYWILSIDHRWQHQMRKMVVFFPVNIFKWINNECVLLQHQHHIYTQIKQRGSHSCKSHCSVQTRFTRKYESTKIYVQKNIKKHADKAGRDKACRLFV